MKWSDDLKIGVPAIDEQHKALFAAVDDLYAACSQGLGRKKVGETLTFLKDYVATHFHDEEEIQKKCGYPDYPNHKKLHEEFVAQVEGYAAQLMQEGATIAFVGKFNGFVSNWLLFHISREDKKLGEYIRKTGAAAE